MNERKPPKRPAEGLFLCASCGRSIDKWVHFFADVQGRPIGVSTPFICPHCGKPTPGIASPIVKPPGVS